MTNPYYNHGSFPAPNSAGASASMRAELDAITAGFNKLPGTLTANNIVFINSSGTALEARSGIDGIVIGGTTPAAGSFTTLTLSSALALPAGSVGAPGAAFAGDTNNGWWAPAADTQAWSLAGAESMRLNSTGLGIGGAPSVRRLTLGNNANASEMARFRSLTADLDVGLTASGAEFYTANNISFIWTNNATVKMTLDTSGRLGLGGSPSGERLALGNNTNANETIRFRSTAADLLVGLTASGAEFYTANNVSFYWTNNATVKMQLDTSGKLGIGLTPSYLFDVAASASSNTLPTARIGNQRPIYMQPAAGSAAIFGAVLGFGAHADSAASNYIQPASIGMQGGALIVGPYGGGLDFYAYTVGAETGTTQTLASTLRMSLSATGALGLGVTPLRPFHVKSATSEIVRLETTTARGSGQIALAFLDPTGQKGYVGYGSANDKFEIINQLNADMNFYTNATLRMSIQAGGTIIDGAGFELGFKGLPAASVTTGAFAASDRGKCIYATAGVTIPNSTMAATDTVIVQNTTGSAITITKTITTAYNTGTGAALGATFTLGARGRMAIVFNSSTECYVSGNIT